MVKKTSKAQIEASRNWETNHPEQAFYKRLRRQAFNFVDPKPGTKGAEVVNGYDGNDRINDLKELILKAKEQIEKIN